jgi:putative transposase
MFAWVYNHCIDLHKRYYSLYKKHLNKFQLQKHLTKLKTRDKAVWKQLPSQAIQDVTERVDKSYKLFFSNIKSKKRGGTPRFKKRDLYKSFTLKQAGWSLIDGNRIKIGKKEFGFHKSRDISGEIKTLTIKRNSYGDIYIYFVVKEEIEQIKVATNKIEGFDFGLKDFLVCSDGTKISSPEYHKTSLNDLRKAHRALSLKQKGSNNRKKAKISLAKLHEKIANQRRDFLMKLARSICMEHDVIGFENLSLKGMQRLWGRKVSDLAFGEFMGYIEYYCMLFGTKLVKADRFFASSHICSDCGHKREGKLLLSDREWVCEECGVVHDRDMNAAVNIRNYAVGASTARVEDRRPAPSEAGILC